MKQILLVLLFIFGVPGAAQSAGQPNTTSSAVPGECPCIDPNEWVSDFSIFPSFKEEQNCTELEGVCYPRSYGAAECKEWDLEFNPFCKEDVLPAHCSSEFCYVDPQNCGVPHDPSDLYPGLYYSYETCGNLNDYSDRSMIDILRSRTIRISYPSDSGTGYTVVTDARTEKKKGSFPSFMNRIINDLKLSVTVHNVSQESRDAFPDSSFSACVHEVALGRTDLCIGNFWPTAERTPMAQFTTELFQDRFYLVTFKKSSNTVAEFLSAPFKPFTFGVWVMIVVALVGISAAYILVEGRINEFEFYPGEPVRSKFFTSFYLFVTSFFGAAMTNTPRTSAGRSLTMGFGFFVLVMLASYTASLASYLVSDAYDGEFTTIEKGVNAGKRFCGMGVMESAVLSQYPQISALYTSYPNASVALDKMNERECDAAIIPENMLEYAHRGMGADEGEEDKHCNKVRVGDVVLSIGNSMPVSPVLHRAVSWAIVKYDSERPYAIDEADAKFFYLKPFACVNTRLASDTTVLDLYDLGGTLVITSFVIVLSLGWYVFRKFRPAKERKQQKSAPVPARRSVLLADSPSASFGDFGHEERIVDMIVSRLREEDWMDHTSRLSSVEETDEDGMKEY